MHWDFDNELRPYAFVRKAFYFTLVRFGNELVANGHAHASAFPHRLSCKKRVKNSTPNLFGNTRTIVSNADNDAFRACLSANSDLEIFLSLKRIFRL